MNARQAPIVHVESLQPNRSSDECWTGYRPDLIHALAAEIKAANLTYTATHN